MKKLLHLLFFATSLSFGQVSDALMTTKSNQIRDETVLAANTKTRFAALFTDLINSKIHLSQLSYAIATGTNDYVITISPPPPTLTGLKVFVLFTNGNNAASTINVNGLGVKNIVDETGSQITSGLASNAVRLLVYNGTNFQFIGSSGGGGSGTVTSVSVTTANGISGTVATATTTPAITLTLGSIAPTSVSASGSVTGSNLSGTNTGDQINITGNAATVTTNANLTGVVTSTGNATAIANGAITNAMLANGAVANLSNTNTGDQTSISTLTGTLAQFNTALTDDDFVSISGSESITNKKLGSLTSNGYVKTSGGDGTLSVTNPTTLSGYGITDAWNLGSGGTYTAANTMAMAGFNLNLLNGNTLSGPTGATITANTRQDIRGIGTTTALAFRIATSTNLPRVQIQDNGLAIFQGNSGNSFAISHSGVTTSASNQYGFTLLQTVQLRATASDVYSIMQIGLPANIITSGATGQDIRIIDPQPGITVNNSGVFLTGINYNPSLSGSGLGTLTHRAFSSTSGNWLMGGSGTNLTLGGGAIASQLRLLEPSGSGTNFASFEAPALAADNTYILPNAYPSISGQVLSSSNTGTMSWVSATDPMTTRGDIIIRDASNITSRLGVGGVGTFLSSNGTDVSWAVPSSTTYYAPSVLSATATDADFTAAVNSIRHIPDGVATANRVITIPTGADGDVIELYNNEDTLIWSLTGAAVYLLDRTTTVTTLLFNVPTLIKKLNGLWIITN